MGSFLPYDSFIQNEPSVQGAMDSKKNVDLTKNIGRDIISQKKAYSPEVAEFLDDKFGDFSSMSSDLTEELSGQNSDGNVQNLLSALIETKVNSAIQGAEKVKAPQEKKSPEVSWTPLIQPNQSIEAGEAWGQFHITKNGEDENNGKNEDLDKKGVIVELPTGKNNKDKKSLKIQQTQTANAQTEQKSSGGSMSWIKENGKIFIIDTSSGSKKEVPENGAVYAEKPMRIKTVGQGGNLKGGEILYTYESPNNQEENKNKTQGENLSDEEKKAYDSKMKLIQNYSMKMKS